MFKSGYLWIALLSSLLLSYSCKRSDNQKIIIDFNSPTYDSTTISFHEDKALHVAIAAISSPKESYDYYNELLDFIASKINIPIHTIQKQSYEEVNQLIRDGAVDFAFICSGAYIDLEATNDVNLLVAPVIDNSKHYHAYLITHRHSGMKKLEDFSGKSFAFSDPLSHTGYYYPLARLKEMDETPEQFFSKTVFSFGHDFSIEMVNREIIDGAYVHGHIYDYLTKFRKEKVANTQIIEISEAFGIPPVVCPKTIDAQSFQRYQKIFLELHKEPRGKEILERLNIDRFEKVNDGIYDGIRTIKMRIDEES